MSDYLNHLATRILKPTLIIQPRLVSLFEPPPPSTGLMDTSHAMGIDALTKVRESSSNMQDHPTRPSIEPASRQPPATKDQMKAPIQLPGGVNTSVSLQPVAQQALNEDRIRPSEQTAFDVPHSEPAIERPHGRLRAASQGAIPSKSGDVLPEPLEPAERPASRRPSVAPMPRPIEVDRTRSAEPQLRPTERQKMAAPNKIIELRQTHVTQVVQHEFVGSVPAPIEPLARTEQRDESIASHSSASVRPAAAQAALLGRPYVPPSTPVPTSRTPPTPQPAPIIRVTIGRIDVRAVSTPTPPPAPRATTSAPLMSLDEYLRLSHDGGRR